MNADCRAEEIKIKRRNVQAELPGIPKKYYLSFEPVKTSIAALTALFVNSWYVAPWSIMISTEARLIMRSNYVDSIE